jgi:hypothetical protein
MVDIVTLTCPSCGGKLRVSKYLEKFACEYCGNEHIVKRDGGVISIEPVVESLERIEAKADKTSSELAIRICKEEISALRAKLELYRVSYSTRATLKTICLVAGSLAILLSLFVNLGFILPGLLFLMIGLNLSANKAKLEDNENSINQAIKAKEAELKHHENILGQQV